MTQTAASSDLSLGLGLVFTVLGLLATVAMGVVSFQNVVAHDPGLQVLSGYALAGALLAGGLAIVALHVYHD